MKGLLEIITKAIKSHILNATPSRLEKNPQWSWGDRCLNTMAQWFNGMWEPHQGPYVIHFFILITYLVVIISTMRYFPIIMAGIEDRRKG